MASLFHLKSTHSLPNYAEIISNSPSNIALVKYWGKKPVQMPTNPSISFTLENCYTETSVSFKKSNDFTIQLLVDGKEKESFLPKIKQFVDRIKDYCPYLFEYNLTINTKNTFPHSSGIASSASGFSALSLAIMQLEKEITNCSKEYKTQKASFISRLGSGSACRSLYGPMGIWGKHEEVANSSDEFAVPFGNINSVFENYQDTVLLVDKGSKKVSSTVGHQLMHNHPYAKNRFNQANMHLSKLLGILNEGNMKEFIEVTELEALTLHAMMMTSNPYFILMKEGTLSIINKIWEYREATNVPISFTLDAGANVHVLYPHSYKQQAIDFIKKELVVFCENQQYICDQVGSGAKIIKEEYA